jgi:hypothetical protein
MRVPVPPDLQQQEPGRRPQGRETSTTADLSTRVPRSATRLLALQRLAGNRAVCGVVQRCGDQQCDCTSRSDAEREGGPVVQRLDPENERAWSYLGRGDHLRTRHAEFMQTVSAAPEAGLRISQQLERDGPPTDDAKREVFEERLRRYTRLTAIGMMASHRATVAGRRSEMLNTAGEQAGLQTPDTAPQNATAAQTPQAIRATAEQIAKLDAMKERLTEYRDNLRSVSRQAIISTRTSGRVTDWAGELVENSEEYRSSQVNRNLHTSLGALLHVDRLDDAAPIIWGAGTYLADWRQKQIDGVDTSLTYLYDAFPFFSHLAAEDVTAHRGGDTDLMTRVQGAYVDLLEHIDAAIAKIGAGDIDAMKLPVAVRMVKTSLPLTLRPAIDQVLQDQEVREFWTSMGLTVLQAALVFVPVVGPFLAAGIGAIQIGTAVDDMMDRQAMADASTSPDHELLGVGAPNRLEWAMRAVEIALTLADLRLGFQQLEAARPRFDVDPVGPHGQALPREGTAPHEGPAPREHGAPSEAPRPGIGPASDRPLENMSPWERTLNRETQDILRDNPNLRRLYGEMNPRVRRLLTRCASPCIPSNATAAEVARIEALIMRIRDLAAVDELLLKEYFYAGRANLGDTIAGVERAANVAHLRRLLRNAAAARSSMPLVLAPIPDPPGHGLPGRWGDPTSPSYGHSVREHGAGLNPKDFRERAMSKRAGGRRVSDSQWYDDALIVEAERRAPTIPGEHVVEMSRPIGRVYLPDGSIVSDVQRAIVVRGDNGALITSYPTTR